MLNPRSHVHTFESQIEARKTGRLQDDNTISCHQSEFVAMESGYSDVQYLEKIEEKLRLWKADKISLLAKIQNLEENLEEQNMPLLASCRDLKELELENKAIRADIDEKRLKIDLLKREIDSLREKR